jgi:hypothetical protein
MIKRMLRMTAVLGAAWAAVSCEEGPLEPPERVPWDYYGIKGLARKEGVADIYMLSAAEGWAVTYRGYILRFDGKEWRVHGDLSSKYSDINVTRLSFSNPQDGWAVGYKLISTGNYEGYVFRYDGRRWTRVTDIPLELEYRYPGFYDVEALAPDDIWLTAGRSILHYDGEAWVEHVLSREVAGVSFSGPDYGWAVGGGHSYLWNGTSWEEKIIRTAYGVTDVSCAGAGTAWAVGGVPSYCEIPAVYEISRWDEEKGEWVTHRTGRFKDPHFCLDRVCFAPDGAGWAVGSYIIIKYYGREWREIAVPPSGANCVFTLGGDDVWVGGYGCLYKYAPLENG